MVDPIAGQLVNSEYLIPIFLGMVFVASLLASRTKIPYSMILAVIGIGISLFHYTGFNVINFEGFKIDPKLILYFIVPSLIFEAMMKVNRKELKTVQISTFLLATIGTVLATIVGGFLLGYISGLPYIVAFAFAALIASTDAAVVIEVFKRVRVPRPLSSMMESEASLNDATGVILFSAVIAIALASGGTLDSSKISGQINVNILGEIEHFAIVFFGGAAIGLSFAAATHGLHRLIDDPFSETGLTVAIVFGSVVVANSVGVSGLVAVAVAGLYFGNVTTRHETTMSIKVKTYAVNFWEMIAFFANSLAFLYLGVSMDLVRIVQHLPLIILAFVVVLAARATSIYPLLTVINKFTKEKIPTTWRHVAMIGSMRGALSVALVGTLPESDFKETLQTITFGVVLGSLIIQYPMLARYARKAFQGNTVTGNKL